MAGNPSIIVEYIAETAKLVAGTQAIAKSGEQAGSAMKKVDWGRIAKVAGATAAIGAGVAFVKSASDATVQLTKDTMGLQRATNLDTKTASEWVSVLQTRGIETNTFQTSLGRLSKQMETARTKSNDAADKIKGLGLEMAAVREKGGKDMEKDLGKLATKMGAARDAAVKARGPFAALGINFQQVKAGNISEVILQAADAISKMESPTKRAAAAQALFGKAGLKLLPILIQGRKGIEDNLKMADKYGATVGDKQVANVKKVQAAQRELALAHKGVQVAIGSALLPAQAELYGSLLRIVQVVVPFVDNVTVMKAALIAAAIAFAIYKVAVVASTIATLGLDAAMLPIIGIVVGVVAAIAALIAVGYLLYKNWDTIAAFAGVVWGKIKAAAMAAFNWIKSNWPLLLGILTGPFGLAIAIIIRNWATIRAAIVAALNAIKSAVTSAWNAIVGVVTAVGNAIVRAAVSAWNAVRSAVSSAMGVIRGVVSAGFNAIVSVVRAAVSALVGAIRSGAGRAGAAARAIVSAVKGVFSGAATWLVSAGADIVQGLANGITGAIDRAVSAAHSLASKVTGALGKAVGVLHSPSVITYSFGQDVVAGLTNGIKDATPKAERAAAEMAVAAIRGARGVLAGAADQLSGYLTQAFQAKQAAAKTPAEKALEAMQTARDEAGRQQALADAQAQMAAATTDEERLAAQKAYEQAQYDIRVASLTKQAEAEKAAQAGAQYVQQQAFDKSLKALQTYLASSHATAAGARKRIHALMGQFGIDLAAVGDLLGASFAKGLDGTEDKVVGATKRLVAAIKRAIKAGLKIGSPSRVMEGYGREVSRGLALGITRNSGLVSGALNALMPTGGLGAPALLQPTAGPIDVRVFIGDQELRGMVRTEIASDNSRVARRLLAGNR